MVKSFADMNHSQPLNMLVQAVHILKTVHLHEFVDRESAKTFCLQNNNAVGISQTSSNKFVVYSTSIGPPFKIPDEAIALLTPNWIFLKAHYYARKTNILCNLKNSKHIINKKGRVREAFQLSKNISIKLVHHTCVSLDHKPCKNCKNTKSHAKCLAGYEFYALCKGN